MLVKLFGVLDLLGAIFLVLLRWNIGNEIAFVIAALLGVKVLVFLKNWASIIDLICVVVIVLAALGHYYSFSWLFSVWLLQKSFFSFFA